MHQPLAAEVIYADQLPNKVDLSAIGICGTAMRRVVSRRSCGSCLKQRSA